MIHLALTLLAFLFLLWLAVTAAKFLLLGLITSLVYPIIWWDKLAEACRRRFRRQA